MSKTVKEKTKKVVGKRISLRVKEGCQHEKKKGVIQD